MFFFIYSILEDHGRSLVLVYVGTKPTIFIFYIARISQLFFPSSYNCLQ